MKIIAGRLGGRRFEPPRGNRTHPMSDKVRGALFNSLGSVEGETVLDAFAGTGALGFEALSRGASFATLVDSDKRACFSMKDSATMLGISESCKIICANVSSWSNNNINQTFSIVIAAPPYDRLQPSLVNKLTRHLKKDSIFVVDWPGKLLPPQLDNMKLSDQKNYGDAQLAFYRPAS